MTRERKRRVALLLNSLIIVLEITGNLMIWQTHRWGLFQFYTQDSNILLLLTSILYAVCLVRTLRDGDPMPLWARVAHYMAVCTTTVTFVVVLTVLGPMGGFGGYGTLLFGGSMLFCHTLCPILGIVSLVFFEPEPTLTAQHTLMALIPTVLYAVVSIILNVARVWHGPYPFLYVYEQPFWLSCVWFAVIVGGAWLLAWLLRLANGLASREYVY